eukprot:6214775-Pleurochrysis_carterae.AAC.3
MIFHSRGFKYRSQATFVEKEGTSCTCRRQVVFISTEAYSSSTHAFADIFTCAAFSGSLASHDKLPCQRVSRSLNNQRAKEQRGRWQNRAVCLRVANDADRVELRQLVVAQLQRVESAHTNEAELSTYSVGSLCVAGRGEELATCIEDRENEAGTGLWWRGKVEQQRNRWHVQRSRGRETGSRHAHGIWRRERDKQKPCETFETLSAMMRCSILAHTCTDYLHTR